MTITRQICSTPDHFSVHDYSEDAFTYHCHEGCPGHDVRSLDCQDKTPKPTEPVSILEDLRAEEDAELEAREAADNAEDKYLDQLDTLGGASPDEHAPDYDRREERD